MLFQRVFLGGTGKTVVGGLFSFRGTTPPKEDPPLKEQGKLQASPGPPESSGAASRGSFLWEAKLQGSGEEAASHPCGN